jgi:hypothetical protein
VVSGDYLVVVSIIRFFTRSEIVLCSYSMEACFLSIWLDQGLVGGLEELDLLFWQRQAGLGH